jgi:hypothetical protein
MDDSGRIGNSEVIPLDCWQKKETSRLFSFLEQHDHMPLWRSLTDSRDTVPERRVRISRTGGWPKKRPYSRLNWLALSYPTSSAALGLDHLRACVPALHATEFAFGTEEDSWRSAPENGGAVCRRPCPRFSRDFPPVAAARVPGQRACRP